MYTPAANVVLCNVTGVGDLTAKLLHFSKTIGFKPSEYTVLLLNKRPKDVTLTDYQGKAATIKVDGVLKLTGNVMRVEKRFSTQDVIITAQDYRWKMNASYVGATLLDPLDSDGLPTSFNGLPYYGADVTFNLKGLPNRSLSDNTFVPPGFEHNTANAAYWTYGDALEYLWGLQSEVAMPTVSGQTPKDWTIGGTNRKMEELALFGKPIAEACAEIINRTRCQWYLDASNVPKFFAIDAPVTTLAMDMPDPDSPSTPTANTPIEFNTEISVDDAIGQLDIVGGKQQREVMLKTTWTDGVYHDPPATVTDTDFTQGQWFGISVDAGFKNWTALMPGTIQWSNYNVERYLQTYINNAGWIINPGHEWMYRYDIKHDIYAAHKIGPDLPTVTIDSVTYAPFQPYRMLSQLLVARDKNGKYINPDEELAYEGVSPLELLRTQYPDGCTIDLDRGYLLARGVEPLVVNPLEVIAKPYRSTWAPTKLTIAFECAYRAYKTASTSISGMPLQIRRCIVRDELIHKTREATEVLMPMGAVFDALGNVALTEGVPVPTGATPNYSTSTTIPLQPANLTITLPAGIVLDGLGGLDEIKNVVSDYVGLRMINGNATFPTWKDIDPGTRLTGATSQYDTTDLEIVTAISFSDEQQQLEVAFTNRLGNDVMALAAAFVDQRAYRRPL